MRQALFPHFIPETQTARGNLATVIQLVPSGDSGKGTSDFQEPGTHVLTLTTAVRVRSLGFFSVSSPSPSHSRTVSSVLFLEPEQLLSRDSALPARANAQKSESANCSLTTRRTGASPQTGREARRAWPLPTGCCCQEERPGLDPCLDHGPLWARVSSCVHRNPPSCPERSEPKAKGPNVLTTALDSLVINLLLV